MAKDKFDYFKAFEEITELCCQEAATLLDSMKTFDPSRMFDDMNDLHRIENEADKINHAIYDHLAKEFITPIERDDILELADRLDDIADTIDDVMMRLFMYGITKIRAEGIEVAEIIVKSCELLREAMKDFASFKKKAGQINELLIEVSDLEDVADKRYVMAVRKLHIDYRDDPSYMFTWENMMVRLEKCCDACAHAGDTMRSIIMKNS
ncbi:MAG: DUF47 domain-containing protein [Coriobacteriales bacterium]|jgi:predicted phosphate transport protein (TIGR00153 family)